MRCALQFTCLNNLCASAEETFTEYPTESLSLVSVLNQVAQTSMDNFLALHNDLFTSFSSLTRHFNHLLEQLVTSDETNCHLKKCRNAILVLHGVSNRVLQRSPPIRIEALSQLYISSLQFGWTNHSSPNAPTSYGNFQIHTGVPRGSAICPQLYIIFTKDTQ